MTELTQVNRIEVIDWTNNQSERAFTKWVKDNFKVSYDLQDDGKTLKIFLEDLRG